MNTTIPEGSVREEQFGAEKEATENKVNDVTGDVHDVDNDNVKEESPLETVAPTDSREELNGVAVEEPVAPEPNQASTQEAVDYSLVESNPIQDNFDDVVLPPVDYSSYSKNDLVDTLELLVDHRPPSEIRQDVERIKALFHKKIRAEAEERKQKFLADGGNIEEYHVLVDPLDVRVKEILDKYREKKFDYGRIQEVEKIENLKKKYEIIDKIKELVNREESINKTFQEFRSLQNEWRSIGAVPQASLKDLWENYHHNVEIFYDYIKINNELKDLDLKKNLEAKVCLCEKAEELLKEANAVSAFKKLQEYHDQWREIGPVPADTKDQTWERFKEATTQINKKHHDFYDKQKEEQKKNLEAKNAFCEEVEAINQLEFHTFKEFNDKANRIIEIQQLWKKTGFTPKKQNNKIYQRFRDACDAFFEKKRVFYNENKDVQVANLQKKIELCEKAEAVQDSADWKATTEILIQLQKEWKEVGQTPRKQSDKCWKRFRKACDHFFDKKTEFFANIDTSYTDNLNAKLALIDEVEKFVPDEDARISFDKLKEYQQKWVEIGYVPFNKKEEVNNSFKNAINKQFDKLKMEHEDINVLKYKNKLDGLKSNPKLSKKVRVERDKFYTKIKQLESDIVLWENNIGFFAKSANAEMMIREVESKIENAKKTIKTLEEKVKIIDQSGLDE